MQMKKKKILAAALAAAMVLAMPLTVSANWQQDTTGNWSWTEDGTKATGWKQVGSTWYYFNADGVMQTGWQKLNGNWFFLKSSGAMATGWEKVDGKWYFMKDWGGMTTGWVKTGGKWYHMDGSGAMQTGKVEVNGATYFLDAANGAMKTGFITEGDKTYFSSDYGVQTGVVEVNGKTYYFDEEDGGAMVTGSATIDGKTYNFDEDGVCTSRTKPVADATFETAGDGSIVTPSTPDDGGNTGGDTGDTGPTGGDTGDTGSTGGSSSVSSGISVTAVKAVRIDGSGPSEPNSNVGKYTVSNDGNIITVKATEELKEHASSAGKGEHAWVGMVITTEIPVEELFYKSSSMANFIQLTAQETVDSETQGVTGGKSFVFWMPADTTTTTTFTIAAHGYRDTAVTVNFEGVESKLEACTPRDQLWTDLESFATPNPEKSYFDGKVTCSVEGTTVSVDSVEGKTIDLATWTAFNTAVPAEQKGYYVLVTLKAPAGVTTTNGKLTVGAAEGPKTISVADGYVEVIAHFADEAALNTPRTWTIDWDGEGKIYEPTEYTIDCSGVNVTPVAE